MATPGNLRIALVHDWLTVPGGSEDVFREIAHMYPGVVFTSQFDSSRIRFLEGYEVRTSFVQGLPLALKKHYLYAPILADVYADMDVAGFDLILSDSHSFAHGVRKDPGALHICYYHTPARSIWTPEIDDRATGGWLHRMIANRIRRLDWEASKGPDIALANSRTTAERVERFYRRPVAKVIYPPVEVSKWLSVPRLGEQEGFLYWGRLIPYKRVDLAIEAAKQLGFRLNIVGSGPSEQSLRELAEGHPNIRFHGRLPDSDLRAIMAQSKAVLFPCYEDFGIVPVEAMAAGLPVVAYGVGGASETVLPEFGSLFFDQTAEGLVEAVKSLDGRHFDSDAMRAHAKSFDVEQFRARYRAVVDSAVEKHFAARAR